MKQASETVANDLSPTAMPSPIISSQTLGWQSLVVEEFKQPPGSVFVPQSYTGHFIALCLAPHPYRIHQVVGDRRYTGIYVKGDISITPADVPAWYRAEGDDHYLCVEMSADFLQSIAQEAPELNRDCLELLTEFRVRDLQIEQTLMQLRRELHHGDGYLGRLYVDSLANVLAVNLLRGYSTTVPRIASSQGGLGDRQFLKLSEYINENLDQDIKLADLAQLIGVSQFHFSRLFKRYMGISPHQYLLQQRLERAKQLLKNTKLAIADIALECGFNSQSHLGKYFQKLTGMTPGNYRQS